MKKLLLIIVIGFIACNDTKDPPDDQSLPASTETPVVDSTSIKINNK